MELVSVIIPIYSAEKYIRKCLDSILTQTYTNWEAILVDDGSPDNSGIICDEYAAKDKRFKVIHQENGGVSVARQTGLDETHGSYVIHCDPDDWIEANMLEVFINKIREKDYDMVIADFYNDSKEGSKYISQNIEEEPFHKTIQAKIVNQQLHGSLCNKLIKRECIKEIKFFPSEISLGEDDLFNVRVLNQNLKIAYLPRAFYHYNVDNSASLCHSKNIRIINSRKLIIGELYKILNPDDFEDFYEMKKNVIMSLFTSKQFKLLQETFPETHKGVIEKGRKYKPLQPLAHFLSIAIKGYPKTAYILYQANIYVIQFLSKFKQILTRNAILYA